MTFAFDEKFLSSYQDTIQFFGVGGDWTLDLLYNHQRLYKLS